ncbi:MAG: hypothetical protein WCJ81_03325 [bacterium]
MLQDKQIDVNAIQQASTVSRFVVTELLNAVDCQDCHRPTSTVVNTFTSSRWNAFRLYPGKNFDDVLYNAGLQQSNDYYCVSYVADK